MLHNKYLGPTQVISPQTVQRTIRSPGEHNSTNTTHNA